MNYQKGSHISGDPPTPVTRVSIHPKHNHVIHCVLGFKNPIDVNTLKDELSNSVMVKIPRFLSLLVVDNNNGTEHWKKTDVNLDDHIFIHDDDDDDGEPPMSDDDAINAYLADIALSPPMSLDKPLWELHIMHKHKCSILRVHHAVADGMSLMSLLWTMGNNSSIRCVSDGKQLHHDAQNHPIVMSSKNDQSFRKKGSIKKKGLWEGLMYIWVSLVLVLKFIGRSLWVKDKKSVISGIEGVELWPRKVVTAKFQISDMKTIKNAIPNVTINDVFYGIVWCGLTRYLKIRHPNNAFQDGFQFTGLCPMNLREQPGVQNVFNMISENSRAPWGNIFAMVLLPITYFKRDLNALAYIARAKAVMDQKKRSMEARLCFELGYLIFSLFGSKIGGELFYNLFTHTSFLMSNIAGPLEPISLAANPITFIRITSSAQAHAFTLHMVSYAGKADLQIQVAKEVIPDPEFLATCIENALLEAKEAANARVTK
ncbi:O-acyltransferase WSD1-like [Chenopodium quinoa]|uniref:O-acyltransferase WSD1-like n=1 Tax=Chenopodium quinoa TaxID=63459 RepID=UPI000B7929F2|nr:O-acyltransferase WSD1-like [Chenopodium quinoa]